MDEWRYEPTPDFAMAPLERLRNFPRHPDFVVYAARSVANLAIRAILRTYNRLEIEGAEHLPANGSFAVVANHASHFDAPVLLAALPLAKIHHAFPAAASDYFFTNVPKLAFSAVVMNAMPFDRKENPRQSIDLCRRVLEAPGNILILFPEGTRSLDGTIGRFKPGIGFLVAGTPFPVVPCRLDGAFEAWPKGRWLPRPKKLRLRIGTPRVFSERSPVKEDAVAIADLLRQDVVSL